MNGQGLTISHGCFCGSPHSFDQLRCVWSEVAGYGVVDYRAVGGPVIPAVDWTKINTEDEFGEWPDGAPDDPLIIVLVHHEHEGRIKWQHAPYLADRLDGLAEVMMKANMLPWVLFTQQFSQGLRTAASYRQDVVFS